MTSCDFVCAVLTFLRLPRTVLRFPRRLCLLTRLSQPQQLLLASTRTLDMQPMAPPNAQLCPGLAQTTDLQRGLANKGVDHYCGVVASLAWRVL